MYIYIYICICMAVYMYEYICIYVYSSMYLLHCFSFCGRGGAGRKNFCTVKHVQSPWLRPPNRLWARMQWKGFRATVPARPKRFPTSKPEKNYKKKRKKLRKKSQPSRCRSKAAQGSSPRRRSRSMKPTSCGLWDFRSKNPCSSSLLTMYCKRFSALMRGSNTSLPSPGSSRHPCSLPACCSSSRQLPRTIPLESSPWASSALAWHGGSCCHRSALRAFARTVCRSAPGARTCSSWACLGRSKPPLTRSLRPYLSLRRSRLPAGSNFRRPHTGLHVSDAKCFLDQEKTAPSGAQILACSNTEPCQGACRQKLCTYTCTSVLLRSPRCAILPGP